MLLSWIIRTIPRSPRAFLALLVMVGSVSLLFSALTSLFDPATNVPGREALKFAVGLIIGLPATAVFYYFQHMDETNHRGKRELEILNSYAESEKRDWLYKQNAATPVFTSKTGSLGVKRPPSSS